MLSGFSILTYRNANANADVDKDIDTETSSLGIMPQIGPNISCSWQLIYRLQFEVELAFHTFTEDREILLELHAFSSLDRFQRRVK